MDRDCPQDSGPSNPVRPAPVEPELLPSRRVALAALHDAIRTGRGPVALTGEPGLGKTTIRRSLEARSVPGEKWMIVEATPGLKADGFYRTFARQLGFPQPGFVRDDLLDALAGRSLGGSRTALAVEEAHNLDNALLEEVRVLSNRLGEDDGFAAILLVGQTPLARTLGRRDGAGLASRLAEHVHLRPIDSEEAATLAASVDPAGLLDDATLDRLYRVGEGCPGRIVALARRLSSRPKLPSAESAPSDRPESAEATAPWKSPLIGPTRPPIRVEEGLIEVGWQPEATDSMPTGPPGGDSTPDGQRIDDHYAALQAWQEWATNQGRHPEISPAAPATADPRRMTEPEGSPLASRRNVWADAEEEPFAPFGRLFSQPELDRDADLEFEVENEAESL